ncbi:uncharacterized protein [Coffea arabica]|uniref:malate dehydrogenase n=1 Tax=Coffea arabica TaxID=13443 RepID=A0ABM4VXG4_COFAR
MRIKIVARKTLLMRKVKMRSLRKGRVKFCAKGGKTESSNEEESSDEEPPKANKPVQPKISSSDESSSEDEEETFEDEEEPTKTPQKKKEQLEDTFTRTHLVIIPVGVPRKPAMTKDDLFNINADIVRTL